MSSNQIRVAGQAQYVDGSRLHGHARSCLVCIKDKKGEIAREEAGREGERTECGENQRVL